VGDLPKPSRQRHRAGPGQARYPRGGRLLAAGGGGQPGAAAYRQSGLDLSRRVRPATGHPALQLTQPGSAHGSAKVRSSSAGAIPGSNAPQARRLEGDSGRLASVLATPSFPQVIVSVFPDHDATDRERWSAPRWPQIPSSLLRNQVQTPQTTSNYAEAASLPLRSDYRRRWFIGANLSVFGYCGALANDQRSTCRLHIPSRLMRTFR
jgi:hypothetical protein